MYCKKCGCYIPSEFNECPACNNSNEVNGVVKDFDSYGKLTIGKQTYDVYLSNIEPFQLHSRQSGRTKDGELVKEVVKTVLKFTLVER